MSTSTSCTDTSPPPAANGNVDYVAYAYDLDTAGVQRKGPVASDVLTVTATNNRPSRRWRSRPPATPTAPRRCAWTNAVARGPGRRLDRLLPDLPRRHRRADRYARWDNDGPSVTFVDAATDGQAALLLRHRGRPLLRRIPPHAPRDAHDATPAHAIKRGLTLIEVLLASILSLFVMGASLAAFDGLQGATSSPSRPTTRRTSPASRPTASRGSSATSPSPSQLTSDLSAAAPGGRRRERLRLRLPRRRPTRRPAGSLNVANVKRVPLLPRTTRTPAKEVRAGGRRRRGRRRPRPSCPRRPPAPAPAGTPARTYQYIPNVVNRYNSQNRPVFTYNSTDVSRISKIRTTLSIDTDPTKRPASSAAVERRLPAQPEPRPARRASRRR